MRLVRHSTKSALMACLNHCCVSSCAPFDRHQRVDLFCVQMVSVKGMMMTKHMNTLVTHAEFWISLLSFILFSFTYPENFMKTTLLRVARLHQQRQRHLHAPLHHAKHHQHNQLQDTNIINISISLNLTKMIRGAEIIFQLQLSSYFLLSIGLKSGPSHLLCLFLLMIFWC